MDSNPWVVKLTRFDYPADSPDFHANVYERHPTRGDVFLYICATRSTLEEIQKAAEDYVLKHGQPYKTFLPTETLF